MLATLLPPPKSFVSRWLPLFLCWMLLHSTTSLAAEPLSGKPFEAALDQRIGRSWAGQDGHTLRDVVKQLTESQRVSIVLDRRIDPTQSIELTLPPTALRGILFSLVHKVNSDMSVVGNVVYLGPTDSASKLRTLVELRNQELSKLTSSPVSAKSPWRNRPVSLSKRMSFVWQDFDRPRDILKQVADEYQIEIDGLDKLPHDLWASGSLPHMTATEALSLLLVQFESTFEFVPDRAAIRIVPIPKQVVIGQTHVIPAKSSATIESFRKQFPDVEIEQSGTKLIVRGTVEQHVEIAEWLKPRPKPVKAPANEPTQKLADRRFTIPRSNVVLGDVIKTFTDYGVKISYDAEEFAEAGISLDKKVEINVKDIPVEKLFRDLFEPHGIEVTIEGENVRLRPKAN